MNTSQTRKPLAMAIGSAFAVSLMASPIVSAEQNPFSMNELSSGYQVAEKGKEGSCGEGKCGGKKSSKEGSCGEGKCGGKKSSKEGSCGDKKGKEGSCGDKKGKEGSCGEGKCGGKK